MLRQALAIEDLTARSHERSSCRGPGCTDGDLREEARTRGVSYPRRPRQRVRRYASRREPRDRDEVSRKRRVISRGAGEREDDDRGDNRGVERPCDATGSSSIESEYERSHDRTFNAARSADRVAVDGDDVAVRRAGGRIDAITTENPLKSSEAIVRSARRASVGAGTRLRMRKAAAARARPRT